MLSFLTTDHIEFIVKITVCGSWEAIEKNRGISFQIIDKSDISRTKKPQHEGI